MKSNDQYEIWEQRYVQHQGIAKWPFDSIVSLVMKRFSKSKKKEKVILDYGCGSGNNLIFLVKEGFEAHACDISGEAIKLSKDLLNEFNLNITDERYKILDIANNKELPYETNQFDAIIDRESLCQSDWESIKFLVSEFKRIIKPGGWYLGINFCDHHPDIQFGEHIENGDWHNFTNGGFVNQGMRHLFSINDISELFKDCEIEDILHKNITSLFGSKYLQTSEYLIAVKM